MKIAVYHKYIRADFVRTTIRQNANIFELLLIFYEPYLLPLLILLTFGIRFPSSLPDMIRTTDTAQCSTPKSLN